MFYFWTIVITLHVFSHENFCLKYEFMLLKSNCLHGALHVLVFHDIHSFLHLNHPSVQLLMLHMVLAFLRLTFIQEFPFNS